MNIGIAANCVIFERAGIGKYAQNLLQNLLKIDKRNQYFLYFTFIRHRQERERKIRQIFGGYKNVQIKIFPLPAAWLDFLTTTSLPLNGLFKERLDLYFAPYVAGIPRVFSPKNPPKMIFTCHDLVFLRFPEHRGSRLSNYYLKRHQIAIKNSQKIIVPSAATKKDLIKFLNVPPQKIVLIPEAADERFRPIRDKNQIKSIISRYFDPQIKYILSVGTLEPRKNLAKLVEAFSLLPHQILRQYRLVLVGGQGWNNDQLSKTITNLNLKEKVILPGFVKDEDLPYIYNGASVFVYPSLYEGFGLPPLEAMACGVPVVAAKTSSLPEVVGKAGILIDPQDEMALAKAIKKLILNPKLAKKMAQKGIARAKNFSWSLAARQTLKVFKTLKRGESGKTEKNTLR